MTQHPDDPNDPNKGPAQPPPGAEAVNPENRQAGQTGQTGQTRQTGQEQQDEPIPPEAELSKMTRGELDRLADEHEVDVSNASNKQDVIDLLVKASRKRKK